MAQHVATNLSRRLTRLLSPSRTLPLGTRPVLLAIVCSGLPSVPLGSAMRPPSAALAMPHTQARDFTAAPTRSLGITPDAEEPSKPADEPIETAAMVDLNDTEYHRMADTYLDLVHASFLDLQDKRDDVDVDFSAGVLTVTFAQSGIYVINKQPPNKQIWLSSPKSGPSRYNYIVKGESQYMKAGTATGHWINSRDESTLDSVFLNELGLALSLSHGQYS